MSQCALERNIVLFDKFYLVMNPSQTLKKVSSELGLLRLDADTLFQIHGANFGA